jgi:hypothetical protein
MFTISVAPNSKVTGRRRHKIRERQPRQSRTDGHESARTTSLYDPRSDAVGLDEVERIVY